MQKVWLVSFLLASVYAESVRETETWMPLKAQIDESHGDLVSSGDYHGSDLPEDDDKDDDYSLYDGEDNDYDDEDDEDDDDYDGFSGSGTGEPTDNDNDVNAVPTKPDVIDNKIPDQNRPAKPRPTSNDIEAVWKNEVGPRLAAEPEDMRANVLMAHAGEEGMFSKPEVLAALIAGGAVGLLFAILLILLLVYRMKKKDEGSYELGKKPIYTKAPTTEIYA